jgi:hypothetical protein
MKAVLVADFQALPPRLKFAGALAFAALALMVLDASVTGLTGLSPPDPPRTAPTRVEAPPPAGLRNLAYYPEQLAALTSMADFEPRADSGVTAIPAAESAAPVARKAIRRVAVRESASHPGEAARDLGARIATFWR